VRKAASVLQSTGHKPIQEPPTKNNFGHGIHNGRRR